MIVVTHPRDCETWQERGELERLRRELDVPVTHVVVDMNKGGAVTAIEHSPPAAPDKPATATVYDLPRLGKRETISILIGIGGTIALGILAIICTGDASEEGMSAGCAIRIGLAIAAFMLTVWHVVALLFFGYTRSRGRLSRLVADTLLFGIPPAIAFSLIVG